MKEKAPIGFVLGPSHDFGTGIGNAAVALAKQLLRIADDTARNWQLHFITPEKLEDDSLRELAARQVVVPHRFFGLSKSYLWNLALPRALRRHKFKLIHNAFARPTYFRFGNRYVLTLPDIAPLTVPQYVPASNIVVSNLFLGRTVHGADRIITHTEFSKQDILARFPGLSADTIAVIPHGIDAALFQPSTEAQRAGVRERYGLTRPFVLFVSTLEPRKNLDNLLRAFVLVSRRFPSHELVIVGKKGHRAERSLALIDSLNLTDRARHFGYLPQSDLRTILGLAELLAYPSFFEGFGLPPLEAMACGTPVVAADNSCLPEVLDGGALYCAPEDPSSVAAALTRLLSDPNLREQQKSRARSLLARYTWERAAAETAALYDSLLRDQEQQAA